MWKLWPTKKQYISWSLPSKLTFISAYLGFLTLLVSTSATVFGYLNFSQEPNNITYTFRGGKIFLNENGVSKLVYKTKSASISLVKEEDFDMDGFTDVLFHDYSGSCCPQYYSILSARGEGYIKVLENDEFWSWSDPEIIFSNNRWLFRITQSFQGAGNTDRNESRVTFEIIDGQLTEVERLNSESRPKVEAIKELYSNYYTDNPDSDNETISISHDLNRNGIEDQISCSYWERWGSLTCEAKIDDVVSTIDLGCKRIGVTRDIQDGYHTLVCDKDELIHFNRAAQKYE